MDKRVLSGFCHSVNWANVDSLIRHPRQGVWGFEGGMVGREKARFYGVSVIWGDLGSSGARGFRAGVAHKLAHWILLSFELLVWQDVK